MTEDDITLELPQALVIEDQPDIRELTCRILEANGWLTLQVADGRIAAEMMAQWPAPALIVLDRSLPHVPGDRLIELIRAHATWSQVPIVVVSASVHPDDIDGLRTLGATDCLSKPFRPAQLLTTVERHRPSAATR